MTVGSPGGGRPPGTGRCPRPGCTGRLIGGVCDTCGTRVNPPASQQQPPGPPLGQQQLLGLPSQPGPPPQQQPGPPPGQPQQPGPQWRPNPTGPQFPAKAPNTGGFPAGPPPGVRPGPPSAPFPAQGPNSNGFPAQRPPTPPPGPPALAAPAPTSAITPPVRRIGRHGAQPGVPSLANWAPPGQPLRPTPHRAAEPKVAQAEPPDSGSLSARLSGWEPAPGADATQLAVGDSTQLASPSAPAVPLSGSRPVTGRSARSSRSRSRSTSARRIGGGLVEVPRVPYRDPASAVMSNPEVPEAKRFCSNCQQPVGRGVDGEPGSPDGRCENCGTAFSFRAKLHPGDVLGGQYEVLGALAHGGLGWIYLARDHNVNDRWVVLKGLIDTGDEAAMAAAVAEKQFLSQVEHPNIVKIYNFVLHDDADTGNQVGYIVMEYIGGDSLRQIALAHNDSDGKVTSLPLARVLAYGLEVLPAMGYLHSVGLLYCDLKPDNVIQTDAQVKLIDLGAVRHIDDMVSPIFFTAGYSAPEIAGDGPSVSSDIYTVGRTLAVLSFDFAGFSDEYRHSLPTAKQVPLFSLFGSYHRLLRRATHPDPDRRFPSAEDMSDQLIGVLREVLSLGTREPRPGRSAVFGPEVRTFGAELVRPTTGNPAVPAPPDWADVVSCLPVPQVDTEDPAAGLVGGLASAVGPAPGDLLEALRTAPAGSMEAKLWRARALLELGELNQAGRELAEAAQLDAQGQAMPDLPYDWRISWYRGLLSLAARRPRDARVAFDHVYDVVPGELAPKLALAVSAECCADYFGAARLYELVWRTDRSFVSAAFGLARTYLAQGDRSGALEVLESVPDRSSHFLAAQMAVIATRTVWTPAERLTERDLMDAGGRVERLNLDAERRARLAADVLQASVNWVRVGKPGGSAPQVQNNGGGRVLGCELTERGLRFGLEGCYRLLARLAATVTERVELVDLANSVRPTTLT
ncbi:MAG TPA: tetratricopeptide repeat protein [Pseudonocardiaceae bacterium]